MASEISPSPLKADRDLHNLPLYLSTITLMSIYLQPIRPNAADYDTDRKPSNG